MSKVGLCVAIALLGACSSIPEGYAAREWSKTMREMQIVPVFPPREGVQPGDLYFVMSDQPGTASEQLNKGFLPIGTWVGRVDLRAALRAQYSTEITFPKTPAPATVDQAKKQDQAYVSQPTKASLFGPAVQANIATTNTNSTPPVEAAFEGDTDRPRIVGFPEFASASFSKGDLSALIPVEALNIAGAAGFTSARSVTMSIPVAEYYGVPAPAALHELLGAGTSLVTQANFNVEQLITLLGLTGLGASTGKIVDHQVGVVRFVTEVYMTRAVDVGVHSERSSGAKLAVKPGATGSTAKAGDGAATAAAAPNGDDDKKTDDTSGSGSDPIALANELNTQLTTSMDGLSVPGGSVRFLSAGVGSVSMRRVFERPVAIGYRAIQLHVSVRDVAGKPALYVSNVSQMSSGAAGGESWVPTGGAEMVPTKESQSVPTNSNGPQSPINLGTSNSTPQHP